MKFWNYLEVNHYTNNVDWSFDPYTSGASSWVSVIAFQYTTKEGPIRYTAIYFGLVF